MVNKYWQITDKGDPDARRLVDGDLPDLGGRPHYSRVTPGAQLFTRNGQNLVFITADLRAVWVTFRPTPGKATRSDGLDAWECALFRNEGPNLSSALIVEASELSVAIWGQVPRDGLITYVKPEAVRSGNLRRRGKPFSRPPGYCYLKAGWYVPLCVREKCEQRPHGAHASDGKPLLQAPPIRLRHWTEWSFHRDRGGALRRHLTEAKLRVFTRSSLGCA